MSRVLEIVPLTFKAACQFVEKHHRHHPPPVGHKFSVGVSNGSLVGVAMAGRPIARCLDDGLTLEINRTCTDGTKNVNSMLYGACRKAAWALGYRRCITYTQYRESGASLRAVGFVRVKALPPRGSWAKDSVKLRHKKNPVGTGGIARILWECRRG